MPSPNTPSPHAPADPGSAVPAPGGDRGAAWAGRPAEDVIPELIDAHGGKIYRLAWKLCGHEEDAEDLVQEVFLQAFRKWHQFQGDAEPSTWLYTIAARACTRKRRRRAGEPKTLEALSAVPAEGPVLDLPDEADDPFDHRLRREAQEAVERALAYLPVHYRLALVLKDIVELPIADVASILGIKEATVKTRVHRARLHLRDALLDDDELPKKGAPEPVYGERVCLDLLRAKQEALDRGVDFPVPQEEVCTRCESLFATLDLARDACHDIGHGPLPEPLRQRLLRELEV